MSPAPVLSQLLATDPLLNNLDGGVIIIVLVKTVAAFAVLLVSVLLAVWWERKLIGFMQSRYGPQEAGPAGVLQTLADGVKAFFKEAFTPQRADRPVYRLAPYLAVIPAFLTFAIIPIGGTITIFGHTTFLQLADPPVGILWLLAMSGIAVYGVMLAGWSSGSKYPLLGSVRASAQLISYEAALGLSIAAVVLVSGSLSTRDIVVQQMSRGIGGSLPNWNVIQLAVVPFVVFVIAATAEINRPPFDLTEADSELIAGYMTEYSGISFALFYLAEYMGLINMSAIIVTLFLGGPDGPWKPTTSVLHWLVPVVWFVLKVFLIVSAFVWARASLPRLRYDQLMDLGWKILIPVGLFWLIVIAAIKVGRWPYAFVAAGAGLLGFALLSRAVVVGRARAADERRIVPRRAADGAG
jgi:NADH-quinone oxidoreductase subunit H